jgi:hypothetical protein
MANDIGERITLQFALREDLPYWDRILAGMALIRKYEPQAEASAEHDVLYFGVYNPEVMTNDEARLMKSWGWIDEYDSWAHYT